MLSGGKPGNMPLKHLAIDHWLQTPNITRGNACPVDLLSDNKGKQAVISVLNAIERGGVA
jgi:uncharacterized protein (DUF2384 family)